MDMPEVWMSRPATPRARRAAVTFRTVWLAWPSAELTEALLTDTPIDRSSWLGVPVTVPTPVTVIRAPGADAAVSVARAPLVGLAAAAVPRLAPIANAPTSSAAEATPIAAAR